ncbi:MAG TPA: ankyrin repeat domain-containing protein [Steroidobacteraceae bacterium]|nr:ankyrin repeat domain-containing protein [Steroidobacteraceae bacterium]
MNRIPPAPPDPPDEVDEEYRRASAHDPGRPSEAVRRAVLQHAERLAAERSAHPRGGMARRWWNAVRELRWPAMVGSLAAAALAALVIAPQFFVPRTAPVAEETRPAAPPSAAPEAERPAAPAGVPATAPAAAQPGPMPPAPAVADERMTPVAGDAGAASKAAAAPAARTALAEPVAADSAAAFRHAAEAGDLAALQALRAGQASLDGRDPLGRTALMLATLHGQRGAVEMLLAWGADPNAADAEGTTPLGAAIAGRETELAALLKHYGAR